MTQRLVTLPGGEQVPALGLGTWRMGEAAREKPAEVRALKLGLDLGMTLIDTAEMYGEGGAEEVVGEAMAGRRQDIFLVSKVYPHNASRQGAIAACERSLKRLRTDRLDLYLLHWRASVPLADTLAAFEQLRTDGKIRHWGVSNFDVADMAELAGIANGTACAANQVLYNLGERGIEWQLMGEQRKAGVPVMAYTPLGRGGILGNAAVKTLAERHGVGPGTIAIAWTLRHDGVISIPKATNPDHLRANAAAASVRLTAEDLATLDAAFPPPKRKSPLATS